MRLIDADALLDKFEWKVNSPLYIRAIRATIGAAPTIDAEPHWIPVRESLPKKYQRAILCDRYGGMMIGTMTDFGWMTPCYFAEPVAWMPVPEPYEADGGRKRTKQ